MTPTWIVQTNLIKEDLCQKIEAACTALGYGYQGLEIVPFDDNPNYDLPKGPLIPYGSTTLIKNFHKGGWDKTGLFFNLENLRTSTWIRHLGDKVLNHAAAVVPLKEAATAFLGQTVFVKPDNDLKDFSGGIYTPLELEKLYSEVSAGGFLFDSNIPVVVNLPQSVGWEYRLFMVGTRMISGSSYKLRRLMKQDKRVPIEVIEFAESIAALWHPDQAYVMDVGEVDNGYKVIEFNCLNASGFYNCDVFKVVDEISKLVLKSS